MALVQGLRKLARMPVSHLAHALGVDYEAALEVQKLVRAKLVDSGAGMGATDVAEATQDAYSHDRYGPVAWECIAGFLVEDEGYSAGAAEEVLRSKHMRWAMDEADDPKTSAARVEAFRAYYRKNRGSINRMLLEEGIEPSEAVA